LTTGAQAPTAAPDEGALDYHGGPVLHSSAPYLIFWTPPGENLSPHSETLMGRYLTDVAADSGRAPDVYGVGRQFTDSQGFADYRQTFDPASQEVVDNQPFPATGGCANTAPTYPTCLTDAQLQAEISRLMGADALPAGTGDGAPIYFIVTPPDVNVCIDASTCASNVFCSYHSFFDRNGTTVLYAAIPFFINGASPAQNPKLCQRDGNSAVQEPNGDLADIAISYMSHEDNEVVTDPLGNGWYDSASGNEDGDNCGASGPFDPSAGTNPNAFEPTIGGNASSGTLYDQLINGHPYYTQSEWSNGDGNCEMRPSPGLIDPSFAVPTAGATPVGAPAWFDPGTRSATNQLSSATWSFGDGAPVAFDPAESALFAVSHTYATAGRYTATLTLVDDRGNVATATEPIIVGLPPVGAFGVSPGHPLVGSPVYFDGSGSSDPDTGVTLRSYLWTFGDGRTAVGPAPRHTYSRPGSYTVSLSVTNTLGLTETMSRSVTIVLPGRITRLRVLKHRFTATIRVTVSGPGRLSVARSTRTVATAGTRGFTLGLNRAQRAALGRGHGIRLRIPVCFVPVAGPASVTNTTIRFHA
jgi:PKD repeat protein